MKKIRINYLIRNISSCSEMVGMYDGKYDFNSSFYMDLYQDLLDRYNSQLDYYCLDEKITRFIGLVQKESYLLGYFKAVDCFKENKFKIQECKYNIKYYKKKIKKLLKEE